MPQPSYWDAVAARIAETADKPLGIRTKKVWLTKKERAIAIKHKLIEKYNMVECGTKEANRNHRIEILYGYRKKFKTEL